MGTKTTRKAFEISDVKISFVSLVDKAANRREFLIAKQEDGSGEISINSKIIKMDTESHFITGVVYEPMVEDTQGDFMTEEEIQKAAYWFAKNGDKIDLQHNFEECQSCSVVENWVAKADFTVDGTDVKKGTWLLTVEVADDEIWEKVEKGEITGFSMGGVALQSEIDVPLEKEKNTLIDFISKAFGLKPVEKGEMKDNFQKKVSYDNLWTAMYTLMDLLDKSHWNYKNDKFEVSLENDEAIVREHLNEFSIIVTSLLAENDIIKCIGETPYEQPLEKSGKKMSAKNKERLDTVVSELVSFAKGFEDNNSEEEEEVKKAEAEKIITAALAKALGQNDMDHELTKEELVAMATEAVAKATEKPEPEPEPTAPTNAHTTPEEQQGQIEELVHKAVATVLEPLLKSHGLSSNLNDEPQPVEKSDEHYLSGLL